jgi:hypothetical protein
LEIYTYKVKGLGFEPRLWCVSAFLQVELGFLDDSTCLGILLKLIFNICDSWDTSFTFIERISNFSSEFVFWSYLTDDNNII